MEYELKDHMAEGDESAPCLRHDPLWLFELRQMQPDYNEGLIQQ